MRNVQDALEMAEDGYLTSDDPRVAIDDLETIAGAIDELVNLAHHVLQEFPSIHQTAKSYWMAHINGAIDSGRYLGGSFIDVNDTLKELRHLTVED